MKEASIALTHEPNDPRSDVMTHVPTTKESWRCVIAHEDIDGYPCIPLYLEDDVAYAFLGQVPGDQQAVLHIYATTVKTTVVKRDTDLVAKEEEVTHWKELQDSMLDELKIWVKHK